MDSRVVELVSNASSTIYPNNTISSFTNFLPEQIELSGEWEVALMEISYPTQYFNVTEGSLWFSLIDFQIHTSSEKHTYFPKNVILESGLYVSIDDIFISINKILIEWMHDLYLFEPQSQFKPEDWSIKWEIDKRFRLKITLPEHIVLGDVSSDIHSIFGLGSPRMDTTNPTIVFPMDLVRIHSAMIYTDFIEHGVVGDIKAPMLRSFPLGVKIRGGEIQINQFMSNQKFDTLQFRKVIKNSFHSIAIQVRSTTGELIPFIGIGFTRLTLMFRQISL